MKRGVQMDSQTRSILPCEPPSIHEVGESSRAADLAVAAEEFNIFEDLSSFVGLQSGSEIIHSANVAGLGYNAPGARGFLGVDKVNAFPERVDPLGGTMRLRSASGQSSRREGFPVRVGEKWYTELTATEGDAITILVDHMLPLGSARSPIPPRPKRKYTKHAQAVSMDDADLYSDAVFLGSLGSV